MFLRSTTNSDQFCKWRSNRQVGPIQRSLFKELFFERANLILYINKKNFFNYKTLYAFMYALHSLKQQCFLRFYMNKTLEDAVHLRAMDPNMKCNLTLGFHVQNKQKQGCSDWVRNVLSFGVAMGNLISRTPRVKWLFFSNKIFSYILMIYIYSQSSLCADFVCIFAYMLEFVTQIFMLRVFRGHSQTCAGRDWQKIWVAQGTRFQLRQIKVMLCLLVSAFIL